MTEPLKQGVERATRSELARERIERAYWMQSSDIEWLFTDGKEVLANVLFHPDWGLCANVAISENEDECIGYHVTVGGAKQQIEDHLEYVWGKNND